MIEQLDRSVRINNITNREAQTPICGAAPKKRKLHSVFNGHGTMYQRILYPASQKKKKNFSKYKRK